MNQIGLRVIERGPKRSLNLTDSTTLKEFAIMKLEQTAIHEAGHVVVGYLLGLACNDVALTHDEVEETDTYGYVTHLNPAYSYEHGSLHEGQRALHDECIACCAGLAAEHVFFGVSLDTDNENSECDFQNIIEYERYGLRIRGKRGGFSGDATWRYIDRQLPIPCT